MTKKSNSKMMGSAKIAAIIPQMSTSPKGLRKSRLQGRQEGPSALEFAEPGVRAGNAEA